ncbi:DUF2637 domain-containing protein [Streptomyces brasiliscabiei]|uniref:DUF2637 domain-containing protein n=1 Tax=Streptomyces brasiliscabiei TaxID=2736302 RepID=UPI001C1008A4|nr:DUF2637 domain-containing protein [Streptomyces brasiliscabiei]
MKTNPTKALATAAGLVIIALTAAAFWLSYAHLAEVALAHGMEGKEVRAWAWPATLDLFIVAGELLMLRAALARDVDPWAIGLTVVGSGSSIALNVAGVGGNAGTLDYVVAAVPPTAALLAFGALMRQIHQALAERAEAEQPDTVVPVGEVEVDRPEVPTGTPVEVTAAEPVAIEPPEPAPAVEPLVICGDRRVWHPEFPAPDEDDEVPGTTGDRLPTAAAANVIRAAWVTGTSVTETARQATRSTSYVKKVFARLDEERQEGDVEFLADRRPSSVALVPAVRS